VKGKVRKHFQSRFASHQRLGVKLDGVQFELFHLRIMIRLTVFLWKKKF